MSTDSTNTPDELLTRLLLDRDQVASILGVDGATVDNLHRVRRLRAVRVGRENRWKPQTVRDFVESLEPEA